MKIPGQENFFLVKKNHTSKIEVFTTAFNCHIDLANEMTKKKK